MNKWLHSQHQFFSVTDVSPSWLQEQGFKGVFLDMDNTLAPWHNPEITLEVHGWSESLKKEAIKACIVSNSSHPAKVAGVARLLDIPYVCKAKKPKAKGFWEALALLELQKDEVLIIGDQLFTDVLGGNLAGFATCLITPIASKEFRGTKILRAMERVAGRKTCYQNKD